MAAGFGGEVEMMQGMAVVVIGGLSLSTVLTLVLIPTFYLIFDREDRNNRRMQRKIAREVSSAQYREVNEGETIVCGGAADSGAVGADVLGGRHRAAGGP